MKALNTLYKGNYFRSRTEARPRYSGWEGNMSEPSIDMLLACCALYRIGVGTMLTKDLAPLTKEDINRLLKP